MQDGVVLVRMPMYTALHAAVRETTRILKSLLLTTSQTVWQEMQIAAHKGACPACTDRFSEGLKRRLCNASGC